MIDLGHAIIMPVITDPHLIRPHRYAPVKLQSGNGREVCGVLDGLVDYVLEKRNYTYRKPVYLPDG